MLSCVQLIATPWTVAHQVPLSMKFPRRKYRNRLPFPFWGDLPDPGIKPGSPSLQADSLLSEPPGISCISNDAFHRNTYKEKLLIQTSHFTDGKTEAPNHDLFCQRFAQIVKEVKLESASLGQWPIVLSSRLWWRWRKARCTRSSPDPCHWLIVALQLPKFFFFLFPLLYWKTEFVLFKTCTSSTEMFRICKKTCVHNWGFFLNFQIQRG